MRSVMDPIDRARLPSRDVATRLKALRPGARSSKDDVDSAKGIKPGRADYQAVKATLHERLIDEIGERRLLDSDDAGVAAAVQDFAARTIESEAILLNDAERVRLAEELTDETIGMECRSRWSPYH